MITTSSGECDVLIVLVYRQSVVRFKRFQFHICHNVSPPVSYETTISYIIFYLNSSTFRFEQSLIYCSRYWKVMGVVYHLVGVVPQLTGYSANVASFLQNYDIIEVIISSWQLLMTSL